VTLQAAFAPLWPSLAPSASPPVRVTLVGPSAFRGAPLVIALGLAAVALFAFVSFRRPSRRRPVPRLQAGPPGPPPVRGLGPWLRRLVASRTLEGGVWNGAHRSPVPGARLLAGGEETLSGPDGRFRIGPFEDGTVTLRVEAAGFAPAERGVAVPARQEVWIELWPWREHILRAYGEAALAWVPGAPLGERTPAEIARDARRLSPEARAVLSALTDLVQDACYSPRAANGHTWQEVARLLARLGELGSPAPGPEGGASGSLS
jgi:hypothetical protein